MSDRLCKTCSAPLPPWGRRGRPESYCAKCRARPRAERNTIACAQCGDAIPGATSRRRFCSIACARSHRAAHSKGTCQDCGSATSAPRFTRCPTCAHHRVPCVECGSMENAKAHGFPVCDVCRTDARTAKRVVKFGQVLARLRLTAPRECPHCGSMYKPTRAVQTYCSKSCKAGACRLRTGKGRSDSVQGVVTLSRMAILRRADGCCGICGEAIDITIPHGAPRRYTIDHVVPIIEGGTHTDDNVQPAHAICNVAKGAELEASEAWTRRVAIWNARQTA